MGPGPGRRRRPFLPTTERIVYEKIASYASPMTDNTVGRSPLCRQSCDLRSFLVAFLGRLPLRMALDAVVHGKFLKRSYRRASEGFHRAMAGLAGLMAHPEVNPVGGEKNQKAK